LTSAEDDDPVAQTLEFDLYPFVVGDVLKLYLYLAAPLVPAGWRLAGRLRPPAPSIRFR
jgi:hypothetical protein